MEIRAYLVKAAEMVQRHGVVRQREARPGLGTRPDIDHEAIACGAEQFPIFRLGAYRAPGKRVAVHSVGNLVLPENPEPGLEKIHKLRIAIHGNVERIILSGNGNLKL